LLDAGSAAHPPQVTGSEPPYDFESTHLPARTTALTFDAGRAARYAVTGDAFEDFPMSGAVVGEALILGHTRHVANTYTEAGGDRAVGTLVTQPFALVGDVMEFWVGGGAHSETLRVSLLIDGTRQFSSGGCGTEIMGRRLWQIAPFKGRQAVLEIVDEDRGGWGHISVDKVMQWVPKA